MTNTLLTINTNNVIVSLTKFKDGHVNPFKKEIIIDFPNGYVYDYHSIPITILNKDKLYFIRCKNIITNKKVYFILTKSNSRFKFIDFTEVRGTKKKYKLRKFIGVNHIDFITTNKTDLGMGVIVWFNENHHIHQRMFLKTSDKKWNLYEKRKIGYKDLKNIIINPNKNIVRLINTKEIQDVRC